MRPWELVKNLLRARTISPPIATSLVSSEVSEKKEHSPSIDATPDLISLDLFNLSEKSEKRKLDASSFERDYIPWVTKLNNGTLIYDEVRSGRMITSTMLSNTEMGNYVFGDSEQLPQKVVIDRMNKWRKKHPEESNCLDIMKKKAYPDS